MTKIEDIILNPGLEHIQTAIFEKLDNASLESCFKVSREWNEGLKSSEVVKRLKLRRDLNSLMGKANFEVDWERYCSYLYKSSRTFLQLFPEWIVLPKYFKRKGTVKNIEEVLQVLEMYISEPDYRVWMGMYEPGRKASPIQFAAENGYGDFLKIVVPIFLEMKAFHYVYPTNISDKNVDVPPISLASGSGHTQIVQFFLTAISFSYRGPRSGS